MTTFGDQVFEMGGRPVSAAFDQGKAKYLVASATDDSSAFLRERGVATGDIFTDLATAVAQLRSGYNDTLYVMPGDHVITAEVNITQNQVRIIGMGGPNMAYGASTPATGIVRISTVTEAVTQVLHITGNYVILDGIETYNNYNAITNVADVYIVGKNFYARNCQFRGGNGATQNGDNSGVPVMIASTAYAARFDDCKIGSAGNTTRTSGPGFVLFEAGAGGAGMVQFNRCIFAMRSETTGDNVSGFLIQNASLDRLLVFRSCTFYNFSVNWGALPDHMINDDQTTTHDILFCGGCGMMGFDAASDSARVMASDPLPHTNAIEALAVAIT